MQYKKVYIKWEDACVFDDGWKSKEELDDYAKKYTMENEEVGFVYKETKTRLVLVGKIAPEKYGFPERFGTISIIPKGLILKRKVLK